MLQTEEEKSQGGNAKIIVVMTRLLLMGGGVPSLGKGTPSGAITWWREGQCLTVLYSNQGQPLGLGRHSE